MSKLLIAICALALTAPAAFADPVPVEPTDKPVIKKESGDTLMWEVPEKNTKPKAVSPEEQEKIDQARYNEASYLQQAAQQDILPPPSDGTAPGAITPPYLPYSTVPGGPYNVQGSVMTPFNIRNYSYGGTSQSFGAPMFYGNEIPNPALAYPAGYPLGGAPVLPLMPQQRPAAGIPGAGATPVVPVPSQASPQGLAVPRSNVMFPDND